MSLTSRVLSWELFLATLVVEDDDPREMLLEPIFPSSRKVLVMLEVIEVRFVRPNLRL